jgi:uncharacterized membrane protein
VTLDAMRGLAALAVAVFHVYNPLVPGGYLAVDFFFVLSGFVLDRTYRPRFAAGLGVRAFMLARLRGSGRCICAGWCCASAGWRCWLRAMPPTLAGARC